LQGPVAVRAQADGPGPSERDGLVPAEVRATYLFPSGEEPARDAVAERLDGVGRAMQRTLGRRLEEHLIIRLHADVDALLRANPLAVEVGGVMGGSRRARRELDVVIPADPTDGGAWDAAVRREVARVLVLQRSGGGLPDAWADGTADFVALGPREQAAGVARLRRAWSEGDLPSWGALAARDGAYVNPPVVRPLAVSAVAHLVQRDGFDRWLLALDDCADGRSWREAVEARYGASVEALEDAWRNWLPGYLDGGWQSHALHAPDVERARRAVAGGDPWTAVRLLEPALPLLSLDDPAAAAGIEDVLAAARRSIDATRALRAGVSALDEADYAAASEWALRARRSGAALPANERRAMEELAQRSALGVTAAERLATARALPAWRALEARTLAASALAAFARLGNDAAAARASEVVAAAERRLRPAGVALAAAGTALLAWNGRRRLRDARQRA